MDAIEATTRIVEVILGEYELDLKDNGISDAPEAVLGSIGKNAGVLYKAVYAAVNHPAAG